ncbi:integrin alpha-PS1 isoform X1 [Euwallacea similis]|uniref:integrin alpha-PS1 isoform X1 n=1 Tax=Euwallacea similis TaxID=1736056 RepID=UPI00344EF678
MYKILAVVICLHIVIYMRTTVLCFNIEQRDPSVKKAPNGQENSYFGFSVALHHQVEHSHSKAYNWILVGAPLGQNLQPGTNLSGALFKCPISNYDQDCEQIVTDGLRGSGGIFKLNSVDYDEDDELDTHFKLQPPQVDEIKDGQWLGVSIQSQKPGGKVMVCAHRYIQSPDLSKFHYGQGLCYMLEPDFKIKENPLQFCKGLPTDKLHQQYGFCQIGTSTSFVGDSALVGAPGPYTWRGTVFSQVVEGDFLSRDKNIYKGPLNDNPTPIDKYSYLGMSVGGGHFFAKDNYTFVAGAPRSQMVGQVYFFDKKPPSSEFVISLVITGEQFASSFGYEVLVVDVNNDGLDDLLVGAPFYYSENKGGAVYVYYHLNNCEKSKMELECKSDAVFYGTEQSRFGFAMTSIGDINKDGYNDVAIGAPYEYGHGAVYIYLGSEKGIQAEPSQVMSFKELKTFGYSLSGGLDMDLNGYPDLLVGAYESERALLFLTRPIIDIKINIRSNDMHNINASRKGCASDRNNQNNTCFSIKACFTIMGGFTPAPGYSFNVIYHITEIQKIIPRIWFRNDLHPDNRKNENTRTIVVNHISEEFCQQEIVYVKEGVSDILSPIKFKVKYTLENDLKPHTPILNTTSLVEFEATFQKDCGSDDVCESNLVLTTGTNLKKDAYDQYIVDSIDKEFIVEAIVENKGESAYQAKLFVFHPTALSYINVNKTEKHSNVKCSFKNDTLVVCDLGNPFQARASAKLKLRFEIVKNTKEQILDLTLKVNSTSKETSMRTEAKLTVVLQRIADYTIIGKGNTNLFFGGEVVGESAMRNLEDIGSRVVHRYYLDNRGEWDLPNIRVRIQWPYQVSPGKEKKQGKWLLYLESLPEIKGKLFIFTLSERAKMEFYSPGGSGEDVGFCKVPDGGINPLNLSRLSGSSEEPENLLLPDSFSDVENENDTTLERGRRDLEYVVEAQEIKKGGVKRQVVVMDCGGSASCLDIVCYVKGLKKKNQVYIEILARLWNSTLVEDYSKVDWVQIKSNAEVDIWDTSFNLKKDQVSVASAETKVYPEIMLSYSAVDWRIIAVAVVAGLLLLIALVLILRQLGFFKRKRAKDKTLSGNLEKSDESNKTLLNKN